MLVAVGIVEYGDRVLMRRRLPGSLYSGTWEFPMTPIDFGDTVEHSIESWVFESAGLRARSGLPGPAFDCKSLPGCRFFPVKMLPESPKLATTSPNVCKWLKIKDLRRIKMSPPSVMYVKQNEKISFLFKKVCLKTP